MRPEALTQRVRGNELFQLGDESRRAVELELRVDALYEGSEAFLLEPFSFRGDERLICDVG